MTVKLSSPSDLIGYYDVDGIPVEIRAAPPNSGFALECLAHDTPEPRPFSVATVLRSHGVVIDRERFEHLKAGAGRP